jgi:hypothetical protein
LLPLLLLLLLLLSSQIQAVDADALGLTAVGDREQATMVNEIVAGEKARRPQGVEKVASGQAKFEAIAPDALGRLRRERALEKNATTLVEHLAKHNVDPADIHLAAEALQKYYTVDQMTRAAQSVATWVRSVARRVASRRVASRRVASR